MLCGGPPSSSMNGVSSTGRGPENSRSQASDPIDVTTDRRLSESRKPTARTRPDNSGSASCTVASPPSSMVATRKMAAGVNGARTGWGSGGGITQGPLLVWPSCACPIHHSFQPEDVTVKCARLHVMQAPGIESSRFRVLIRRYQPFFHFIGKIAIRSPFMVLTQSLSPTSMAPVPPPITP